ncbi:ATP-dependent DNA helicase RecG [Corynebacterium sp. 335C]
MLGWLGSDTARTPLAEAIGADAAKRMRAAYGVSDVGGMLSMMPSKWIGQDRGLDVGPGDVGQTITALVEVIDVSHPAPGGGRRPARITVGDGRSTLLMPVFGQQWLTRRLKRGDRLLVMGTLRAFRDRLDLANGDLLTLHRDGSPGQATGKLKKLIDAAESVAELTRLFARPWLPVRRGRKGLAGVTVALYFDRLVRWLPTVPDPLPDVPGGLPSFDRALREVHFPPPEGPRQAILRLKYDEALEIQLETALRRRAAAARVAPACASPGAARDDGTRAAPDPAAGGEGGAAGEAADGPVRAALASSLPFALTAGQADVVTRIDADLARTRPMNRLLQGEVGSGKTVVAALAMARAIDAGRQCALLAPTEVLAAQHARTLAALFDAAGTGVRVALLTGSLPAAERRDVLLGAVTGEADVVVGTHALLSDGVDFFDLGLVVVDEQHRFGVRQRDRLRDRGRDGMTPHVLVMTATPIPRTIAMTFFGDLEVSTLTELPGGRRAIATSVVPTLERPRWEERAWERIGEELAAGHRAFIVCPAIVPRGWSRDDAPAPVDPADGLPEATDAELAFEAAFSDDSIDLALAAGDPAVRVYGDDEDVPAAEAGAAPGDGPDGAAPGSGPGDGSAGMLFTADGRPIPAGSIAAEAGDDSVLEVHRLARRLLPGARIAVLHGGMRGEDKDRIMRGFAEGRSNVLVSTTVVEVGVDVPEATVMMIRRAEGYGVSQLHQLRGRVGRGEAGGLCLLCTMTEEGTPERARLDAIAGTLDGFRLAELDLAHRSHGDVLGEHQSGQAGLGLLDLTVDGAIVERAREDAAAMVDRDPDAAAALTADITREESDFLDRG